jgi:hypothetical protein
MSKILDKYFGFDNLELVHKIERKEVILNGSFEELGIDFRGNPKKD